MIKLPRRFFMIASVARLAWRPRSAEFIPQDQGLPPEGKSFRNAY